MRFAEHKNNPMPPAELRCIWMTAGVLSYQLCDRQFDCEECPLDRAMRMHFTRSPKAADRPREEAAPRAASLFSRNHFQITPLGAARLRAEIEPRLAGMLPPVKSIVLPAAGDLLGDRSPAAWIVFEDGTMPLVSPIGGKVLRTNDRLLAEPHLVGSPVSPERWLFELSPLSAEAFAEGLATGEGIARDYDDDDLRFRQLAQAEVNRAGAAAGATLADGGTRLDSLMAMVGPRKYCDLLIAAYLRHGAAGGKG